MDVEAAQERPRSASAPSAGGATDAPSPGRAARRHQGKPAARKAPHGEVIVLE